MFHSTCTDNGSSVIGRRNTHIFRHNRIAATVRNIRRGRFHSSAGTGNSGSTGSRHIPGRNTYRDCLATAGVTSIARSHIIQIINMQRSRAIANVRHGKVMTEGLGSIARGVNGIGLRSFFSVSKCPSQLRTGYGVGYGNGKVVCAISANRSRIGEGQRHRRTHGHGSANLNRNIVQFTNAQSGVNRIDSRTGRATILQGQHIGNLRFLNSTSRTTCQTSQLRSIPCVHNLIARGTGFEAELVATTDGYIHT